MQIGKNRYMGVCILIFLNSYYVYEIEIVFSSQKKHKCDRIINFLCHFLNIFYIINIPSMRVKQGIQNCAQSSGFPSKHGGNYFGKKELDWVPDGETDYVEILYVWIK